MNFNNLTLSWFDLAVVVLLIVGLLRGRKRGMSEELLVVLQWLIIVVGGAYLYEPVGRRLSGAANLSLLTGYVIVYVGFAIFVKIIITMVRRAVGEKLVGSDVF